MREEKTSTLEYGVYVLALLMAVFIGWQVYARVGGSRAKQAAEPAEASAPSQRLGGATESAVSVVPAVKLTAVGGRRKKAAAVPPPSR